MFNQVFFNSFFVIILSVIVIGILTYTLFRDLKKSVFPQYLNIFILFSVVVYFYYRGFFDNKYLLTVSLPLLLWFLFEYFIFKKQSPGLIDFDNKILSSRTLKLFFLILIFLVFYFSYLYLTNEKADINKLLIIFLAANPSMLKLIYGYFKSKSRLPRNSFILPHIRTFIFSDEMIIDRDNYLLSNINQRTLSDRKSNIGLAYLITEMWNKSIAIAFSKKIKELPQKKSFKVIEQSSGGISVLDDDNNKYIFGDCNYVKSIIECDEKNDSYYLVRNNILLQKFTFRLKLFTENIRLIKNFDKYGNIVMISSEPDRSDYKRLPFDKAYFNLSEEKQQEIIRKLSEKAPTALITQKDYLKDIAGYDFNGMDKNSMEKMIELYNTVQKNYASMNTVFIFFVVFNMLIALFSFLFIEELSFSLFLTVAGMVLFYFSFTGYYNRVVFD